MQITLQQILAICSDKYYLFSYHLNSRKDDSITTLEAYNITPVVKDAVIITMERTQAKERASGTGADATK